MTKKTLEHQKIKYRPWDEPWYTPEEEDELKKPSTIDFLITYGWAVLVITAVVLALIYFDVINLSELFVTE